MIGCTEAKSWNVSHKMKLPGKRPEGNMRTAFLPVSFCQKNVNQKYGIGTENGLMHYIHDIISSAHPHRAEPGSE